GIVRDPAGNPVAAALVEILARPDASEPALQSLWSDQQGRFCAVCPTANSRPVWVRATCLVGALQAATSGPHMPGTDDIDITLPHASGVWLRVVDAATGSAIERFALQCVPTWGVRSPDSGRRRHDGVRADGKCFVAGPGRGRYQLMVMPAE